MDGGFLMAHRGAPRNQPKYPRTARLNELLREIVAEQVERLDDDRLQLVAITQVAVDRDLHQAIVYFDTFDTESDDEVLEALNEQRVKLQGAIGRQTRLKRTPHLVFSADDVERGAERIEGIIRGFEHSDVEPEGGGDGDAPAHDDTP
jgi:ribosome-binding factor A